MYKEWTQEQSKELIRKDEIYKAVKPKNRTDYGKS